MNTRMNRNRLNVGAYILQPYARSEKHIKEMAECGIEFICCMQYDKPALDLFHKYGVGAMLNDIVPGWWGGDGSRAGQLEATNPMEKYEEAAAKFVDHPAIWAIDVGDEPSALDFPYYGKVIDRVNCLFPNQFAYLNLYPNYASVAQNNATQTVNQLGTTTYAEHIEEYCKNVNTDYICYDFYLYSGGVDRHYENLRIVADACRNTGRSMWIVLQVNSQRPEKWISENNLRFQLYTSLAFGAENIIWACYTAGWWHHQVIDENGEKTEQYDKLKKINGEIAVLRDEYMRFRRVSTHFVGFAPDHPDMAKLGQAPIPSLYTGIFQDVKADNGAPLVVGQMTSRTGDGANALFVCAADDPQDVAPQSYNITFKANYQNITAIGGKGKVPVTRLEDGTYAVPVSSSEGVLIIAR